MVWSGTHILFLSFLRDSTHSNAQSDGSTDRSRSSTVNLKRTRILRKSGLGATVTFGTGDSDDDNDSIAGEPMMDDLGGADRQMGTDESDGDIDEESGSDGDESDADRPPRGTKRRRLSSKNAKTLSQLVKGPRDGDPVESPDADEDMDADDDVTMDHLEPYANSKQRTGGDDDDDDDDDFLNTLENDIDAQLNEDEE